MSDNNRSVERRGLLHGAPGVPRERILWRRVLVVLVAMSLLGCSTPAAEVADPLSTSTPLAVPLVIDQTEAGGIRAQAVVEPDRVATLVSIQGGTVVGDLAAEGAIVPRGETLVTVHSEDAAVAVIRAEAGVELANALLATAEAGATDAQVRAAAAQVDRASAEVEAARARLDLLGAGLSDADELFARARVLEAQLAVEDADDAHDDTLTCYSVPSASGTQEICPALGTLEELARAGQAATQAGLDAARAGLDLAEDDAQLEMAAAHAAVETAMARRDAAQARLAAAEAGARKEALALAEAGVVQSETGLRQAERLRADGRIAAPFDGVVTDLAVNTGDDIVPGTPVATIATLDALRLRTVDLTELGIMNIEVGHAALVYLDSAPSRGFDGRVVRIDPQGRSYFGDVAFDVIVELSAPPDWMRWGMGAEIVLASDAATTFAALSGAAVAEENRRTASTVVEATVAPSRLSRLAFEVVGEIAARRVSVGETVQMGQVVAELESDHQELALAGAVAALRVAEAEAALARLGPSDQELQAAEADLAAALAGLAQARALQRQVAEGSSSGVETATALAELEVTRAQRRQLQAALLWAEDDDDDERARDLRKQLAAVDLTVTAREARLDALPSVATARAREAAAGVALAQANVNAARAALDGLRAAPTAESIQLAQATVSVAAADVAQAELEVSRTTLRAPFDGTVTWMMADVGDVVSPDRPFLVLADLTHLQLETVDLTELDVVHVCPDQTVTFTIDALPGWSGRGTVESISLESGLLGDDVIYAGTVAVSDLAPGLRPGMSAAVTVPASDGACPAVP